MNELYPDIVKKCIKKLAWNLFDFMQSASDDTQEFPTIEECRTAVEETFSTTIIEYYNCGELITDEDIDSLIFSIFNERSKYNLILKFSAKATIIHSNNLFNA